MSTVGKRPASTPRELTRMSDRVSFLYLERCLLHREDNAITAEDADGVTHIPSATIGTLLLGPGTRVTHQAMSVLGDSGAGVVWVGEQGVRFYSGGRSLTRSAALVEAQARLWANQRTRLDVARAMYRMRFPGEDPSRFSRHELLGREGRRVKASYREQAALAGLTWNGRRYVPGDFDGGDTVNQAVTAAAQCMYGIAQTTVAALGCAPGLGFIHSGHELAFVLDIADLYKTEVAIPVAFEIAAQSPDDIGSRTRRAVRDRVNEINLLQRCVNDIKQLLAPDAHDDPADTDTDQVTLQSDYGMDVESGRNYAEDFDW
ncbi:type I-E CRISPR-associated endonuclease Cas1e [Actinomadura hibisca]|uniref:type I-E CRISPR-associated endonuclease Cas1e n=1 Tax=Actinomadura hibisca TaxID=68565 RepID=UPI0008370A7D|nr:type I-E CRISPR-associated endonuclease Cas1e [Actinomadura hibisca]